MASPVLLRRAKLAAQSANVARGGPDAVREVRVYRLREPVSGRSYTVIRIETASGLRGHGECPWVTDRELATAREVLAGVAATAVEPVRARLAAIPRMNAAVNMALLDIAGQMAKAPLYQVLGGPTRHKVRAFAELEGAGEDELKRSAARALEAGYRAFSVPVGEVRAPNHGQAFVLAVRQRMERLRAATGAGTDLVLDGAAKLTPGDAASLAAALERFHPLWFDEPCPLSNLEAVRKISEENVTPVGYGRFIHRAAEFQDLLRQSMIDVLRPDIGWNGVTAIRRMAAVAETYYVAVAPYHVGGPVATAAALHLAASLPNFFIQQIPLPADARDRRMREELVSGSIETVSDGFARLPAGPGLGIRINEEALKKYAAA